MSEEKMSSYRPGMAQEKSGHPRGAKAQPDHSVHNHEQHVVII